jgi:uncharacterized protein (TIGR00159 family)
LESFALIQIVDVLLVCFLLYQCYQLTKESVAIKIILGFLALYSLGWFAKKAGMPLMSHIVKGLKDIASIALVIIFQYEIRKLLSRLGNIFFWRGYRFLFSIPWRKKKEDISLQATALVEACKTLGGSNTGGLIVISSTENLKFYVESGDILDALISKRLLVSIFNKESPLHDGAIIIYKGKIVAARCILPATEQQDIPANFGLRHRAAIGISEITDTLSIVVSEETGQIAIARKGILQPNLSAQELRLAIKEYLKE